ncbi:LOW QUALITY PROTEIN: thioredoxin domain-containing protein 17-like [Ctenocephalides felis]|uniref:LOW QUALITY PROTEIN: thioredoxin domain-containing protein 17-like n=1 Tax=Ctenocephalides felis TaxID=7515 RepID=UPI000E6E295D|nr:LOW QUALITY PROTEIN: thioredoxin domain-containing protein 17-like [Ctenocephalides felis]
MVITHHISGYENFCKFVNEFEFKGKIVHILFSGSKLPDGTNWCPDCVVAQPAIEAALKVAPDDTYFIHVEVGDRLYWKDPNCPFRKDPRTRLMVIPTMIRWGCPQRLEGEKIVKQELVEMLLTDDES